MPGEMEEGVGMGEDGVRKGEKLWGWGRKGERLVLQWSHVGMCRVE